MHLIESLMIIAALVLLAMPVVAVVAIVIAQRAIREIAGLRQRIDRLEAGYAGGAVPAPDERPAQDTAPESETPAEEQAPQEPIAEESVSEAPEPAPEAPKPLVPAVRSDPTVSATPEAARRPSLEERLGARWAVWVGALALSLGGAFLVRFSLEQDLLGPGARLGLATLFALALLTAGEYLRRRDFALAIPGLGPGHVPAALTAAGAVSAFATAYAAYALYGFLAPTTAFLLLGLLGLVTLLAAALHGPLLASLGLIGSFAVPLLTGGEAGQTWPLVPYFAIVAGAAHVLAWLRGWRRLALAASVIALAWTIPMLDGPAMPARLHLIIQTALAVMVFAIVPYRTIPIAMQQPDRGGRAVFIVALAVFVAAIGFLPDGAPALHFPALMIALMLVAGAVPAVSAAGLAALGVLLVTLLVWPVAREAIAEPTRILPGPAGDLPWPEAFRLFVAFAISGGLATAGLGLWRLREAGQMAARIKADYALLLAAAPAAVLVVVYWRLTGAARLMEGVAEPAFAVAAALLASAYAVLAARSRALSQDAGASATDLIRGLCAVAALGNLALALAFWLDRGMLTVAFALAGAGAAFVAHRTGIRMLRYGVGALAILVALRLLWDPGIVDGDQGRTLIFNWLLWGYGVPALAFLVAAHSLGRDGRDAMARLSEALGIVFAVLLVFFQLRHALHAGMPPARLDGLLDAGLVVLTALCAVGTLLRVDEGRSDSVTRIGARIFGLIALFVSGVGLAVTVNPLITGAPVPGGSFLNALLAAYLLPAIVAGAIAVMIRRAALRARDAEGGMPRTGTGTWLYGPRLLHWQAVTMAGLAFVLQALWSVTAIRMAFQGPHIGLMRMTGEAELWAYSAMLLVVGLGALVIGLWRNLAWLRLIAAAYLILAAAKVFFVDLAGLGGPIRAASFIVLGMVLVGVGLLYQRLLRKHAPDAARPPPQSPGD
ncbi:MAG: DUF2339 domain-containing protein [Salinarimonas sp.]|nr:DUF2339 domain-containing protein [Salinarimonas sp.]